MIGQVKLSQARLGQERLAYAKVGLGQARLGQVRFAWLRLGNDGLIQVKLGQVGLGRYDGLGNFSKEHPINQEEALVE